MFFNKLKFYVKFFFHSKKKIKFDFNINTWVAEKTILDKKLTVAFRSFREIRRFDQLDKEKDFNDLVFRFLKSKFKFKNFYDIGASNGIYGFLANKLSNCNVIFVEPYTPSIETILKTIFLYRKSERTKFNVVQAGIDSKFSFSKFHFHGNPVPGETMNSFNDTSQYEHFDRSKVTAVSSQWGAGITLDQLVFDCKLPDPSVVKIDVDGFEFEAVKGMKKCLSKKKIEVLLIEINSYDKFNKIKNFLKKFNIEEICYVNHYEDKKLYIRDYIFAKNKDFLKYFVA